MTFPTKVPSDSLGWIGSLKRTSDKSLFPMALGSCGHRITHQLRPINMNGRSILAVTSTLVSPPDPQRLGSDHPPTVGYSPGSLFPVITTVSPATASSEENCVHKASARTAHNITE